MRVAVVTLLGGRAVGRRLSVSAVACFTVRAALRFFVSAVTWLYLMPQLLENRAEFYLARQGAVGFLQGSYFTQTATV
jgi:hypothetical protein